MFIQVDKALVENGLDKHHDPALSFGTVNSHQICRSKIDLAPKNQYRNTLSQMELSARNIKVRDEVQDEQEERKDNTPRTFFPEASDCKEEANFHVFKDSKAAGMPTSFSGIVPERKTSRKPGY